MRNRTESDTTKIEMQQHPISGCKPIHKFIKALTASCARGKGFLCCAGYHENIVRYTCLFFVLFPSSALFIVAPCFRTLSLFPIFVFSCRRARRKCVGTLTFCKHFNAVCAKIDHSKPYWGSTLGSLPPPPLPTFVFAFYLCFFTGEPVSPNFCTFDVNLRIFFYFFVAFLESNSKMKERQRRQYYFSILGKSGRFLPAPYFRTTSFQKQKDPLTTDP